MDENSQYIYRCNLLSENQWNNIADELYEAASYLEPQINEIWEEAHQKPINHSFIAIYFMLVSYAIENYLKSIIISKEKKRYKNLLENKCELPSELKSHDLCALAKKAGLENLEQGLLKRLTRCAKWKGRYPVPLKGAEYPYEESSEKINKEMNGFTRGFASFDVRIIKKVIKEIKRSAQ